MLPVHQLEIFEKSALVIKNHRIELSESVCKLESSSYEECGATKKTPIEYDLLKATTCKRDTTLEGRSRKV